MFEMMSVGLRPRTSAAMIARTVRMPVPRSWVADLSSTEPSGLIVQRPACPAGRRRPRCAGPRPAVLDRPGAVLAARLALLAPADQLGPHLDLGLVDRACVKSRRARFLSRNSSGSIPSLSARSSIAASVSAQLWGWPGARMARALPKLVKTAD